MNIRDIGSNIRIHGNNGKKFNPFSILFSVNLRELSSNINRVRDRLFRSFISNRICRGNSDTIFICNNDVKCKKRRNKFNKICTDRNSDRNNLHSRGVKHIPTKIRSNGRTGSGSEWRIKQYCEFRKCNV